jgi:imidazole glycerol-phosphate synthase subunit HisH
MIIHIVDYGIGNIRSIQKSLQRIDVQTHITSNPSDILSADKIILPGVGHFMKAVENLKRKGLWEVLNVAVMEKKIPILGICLGMQLMTKFSEEGDVQGFGWIDGITKRFDLANTSLKVPHMGWNNIEIRKHQVLSSGINSSSFFYFVHSYYVTCNNQEDILYETKYAIKFVSGLKKNNIFGVQFHPEKSHKAGLLMLSNFSNY